ncbi:hypothetical protein CEP45_05190 [Mergibacter septicus]|uniref:DUF5389 family protein n=1 Tax=Mergibacter septicus TaxID=221402 RepID=UPI001C772B86|nr:DUF5389 family protein [Mergibacter septicus]QDJ13283.1 hypothetical protein CEP45_05190 [Mergibacter septicus]
MKLRKKNNFPSGFSAFAWAIAIFCLPALLWPLALLLSPNLSNNPSLNSNQLIFMNIFLWSYPFFLFLLARLLYVLSHHFAKLARFLLGFAYLTFYAILYYVFHTGFNY